MSRSTVTPWSDQQRFFTLQCFKCAKRVVAISIGPTSNDHCGALNAFVARSKRAVSPIWSVVLLLEPVEHPWLNFIQTHLPLRLPVVAKHCWHRWKQVACRHVMAIVDEVDRAQRSTHIVPIIGVAIVGRINGADGVKRCWSCARNLQRVEARVAVAKHANTTV